MGSYSTLRIGRIQFSWKYQVPTFLAFLFSDADFYSVPTEPDEDEWFEEIGYRSVCRDVLATLTGTATGWSSSQRSMTSFASV